MSTEAIAPAVPAQPVDALPDDVSAADAGLESPAAPNASPAQPRNPLHGVTLEAVLTALAAHYGWEELGRCIPVRCFTHEPSVKSSLKFLRKTPWAREKTEGLYLYMLRQNRRDARAGKVPDPAAH